MTSLTLDDFIYDQRKKKVKDLRLRLLVFWNMLAVKYSLENYSKMKDSRINSDSVRVNLLYMKYVLRTFLLIRVILQKTRLIHEFLYKKYRVTSWVHKLLS